MDLAIEILLPPFAACLVLTGIHTYLGLHVVSRGVIFVDLALAQIAALGATFAFLLGQDPRGGQGYFFSLLFAFVGAAIFSISRLREQRIPQEAIIGVTFAVASAATLLIADLAPQGSEFVEAMLTGALLWVPWPTILKTALLYLLIGAFHWLFRHRFLTLSLQPERAEAEGWSVRWWDFLFYASFGVVITSSVAMAGVLLVFSFLVIPSVIAMLFAHTVRSRLLVGWTIGTAVSSTGLTVSYAYDLPSGPAVVCVFGIALAVAGVVRYVVNAEHTGGAITKIAASTLGIMASFWLLIEMTASLSVRPAVPATVSEFSPAARQGDVAARVTAALRELEQATDTPPVGAVAALVADAADLHRLMATGQVDVSETAVDALTVAAADDAVDELLEEIAYHAADSWARLRASTGLVERDAVLGFPSLLELLAGDHPALVRMRAAEALGTASGVRFDYDPLGELEDQEAAIFAWQRWWEDNRARLESGSR